MPFLVSGVPVAELFLSYNRSLYCLLTANILTRKFKSITITPTTTTTITTFKETFKKLNLILN